MKILTNLVSVQGLLMFSLLVPLCIFGWGSPDAKEENCLMSFPMQVLTPTKALHSDKLITL